MIVSRVSTEQIAKNVANNKKCINADFKQIFDDEQLRFSKHANSSIFLSCKRAFERQKN